MLIQHEYVQICFDIYLKQDIYYNIVNETEKLLKRIPSYYYTTALSKTGF